MLSKEVEGRRYKIYVILATKGSQTIAQLRDRLSDPPVSNTTLQKDLDQMVKDNLIERKRYRPYKGDGPSGNVPYEYMLVKYALELTPLGSEWRDSGGTTCQSN